MFKKLISFFRRNKKKQFIDEKLMKEEKAVAEVVPIKALGEGIQKTYLNLKEAKKYQIIAKRTKSARIRKKNIKKIVEAMES